MQRGREMCNVGEKCAAWERNVQRMREIRYRIEENSYSGEEKSG